MITSHLLSNPDILKKLKDELQAAFPDPDDNVLVKLEILPYLKAIIKEGVRLSYGVASRMQRVPWEPLVFKTAEKEWVIPAGTPVCHPIHSVANKSINTDIGRHELCPPTSHRGQFSRFAFLHTRSMHR